LDFLDEALGKKFGHHLAGRAADRRRIAVGTALVHAARSQFDRGRLVVDPDHLRLVTRATPATNH